MSDFLEAVRELRSVETPDYENRIEDICADLDGAIIEEGRWPPEFFSRLTDLLSDPKFLSVRTSWHLLRFIQNNWELVSPNEASIFRGVLVNGFDRFGDWMGSFVAAEMLGKFYPDEETLGRLSILSRTAAMPARELVPHGLDTLARATQDDALRDGAIKELQRLLNDNSDAVREEAAISLSRIDRDP